MLNRLKNIAFILALILLAVPARAGIFAFDYGVFSKIPVLDQGRVKPLDTFARSYLKVFSAKDKLPEMSAIAWLAELVFDPSRAMKREVFYIPNPQVVDALELDRRDQRRYSYNEVTTAINAHFKAWHSLFMKPKEDLSLDQEQLIELFNKTQVFADLAASFSTVVPNIEALSPKDSEILRVVPSTWAQKDPEWFSPKDIGLKGYGSPKTTAYIEVWGNMGSAFHNGDVALWLGLSQKAYSLALGFENAGVKEYALSLELAFNQWDFFLKSLILYLGAFVLILTSLLVWRPFLKGFAFALMGMGFLLHAAGIISRVVIMQRPPVTSLYESILFVSFIVVLWGILLELRKKDGIGIIIAASAGVFLHFLGLKYASEGDTMNMLVAVLNTNFWLATHVVCITIGYGCCLVGGIVAHVYLIYRLLKPKDRASHKELHNNLRGISLVAIFFTAVGTILGGIWADQSWGRFWGWDPKENGALLIVLWLAWLIHGRVSGRLAELGFATGMAVITVVVALAWFGVNLLSVGLHSYGFTKNVTTNLALFCGTEILFALACYFAIKLNPDFATQNPPVGPLIVTS